MKILSATQIREWDQYTITNEPIASIDLMERAAASCFEWLQKHGYLQKTISIFCGKGNNGGDGLALARMLSPHSHVKVYILEAGQKETENFRQNLERLQHAISFIKSEKNFPAFGANEIIVDALFGCGLNRPLEGLAVKLVEHLNNAANEIISIDIPSGLPADNVVVNGIAVKADHILTFQCYKLSFLLPANAAYVGQVHVLDIGLHKKFEPNLTAAYELVDENLIASIYQPRNRFAHKGNFGHAIIIAGSYGKAGAAVLATKACVRAGAGLTTVHIPRSAYAILQAAVPEAMVSSDANSYLLTKIEEDLSRFNAAGVGPGIATAAETKILLKELLKQFNQPIVLDADALNILAAENELMRMLPANSILTPHPKEFERLFGKTENDLARFQLAKQKAKDLNALIVLKGHHTLIATPGGKLYFNNTGNAGMAKGGSGDVLTGILTSLLAQNYDSVEAALFGVYVHGLAGDIAAKKFSREAMIATDIIECLGEAFKLVSDLQ